ncbi:Uu.00g136380.m01.CDS01 [Anthostomella pinea]|uniref:Uu.00g136380.m01.CDS01 n=1 Tax=Anthostomella pinea TaxID=933095 RepID=A0AAI8YKW0_9PEZI|nr:Uu.00g136380.m01.CDS01 [Anthostomella pinea]
MFNSHGRGQSGSTPPRLRAGRPMQRPHGVQKPGGRNLYPPNTLQHIFNQPQSPDKEDDPMLSDGLTMTELAETFKNVSAQLVEITRKVDQNAKDIRDLKDCMEQGFQHLEAGWEERVASVKHVLEQNYGPLGQNDLIDPNFLSST